MRSRRLLLELLLVAGLAVPLAGCFSTSEEFPDDTARVELSERSYELEVLSCGRDEDEGVFVLGASSADSFLQLLLSIDGDEVDTEASAVSFESRDTGVLGAGNNTLLQTRPGTPGVIDLASISGDRIDVEADIEPIDTEVAASDAGVSGSRLEVVARCSGVGDMASGNAGT